MMDWKRRVTMISIGVCLHVKLIVVSGGVKLNGLYTSVAVCCPAH